MRDMSLEKKLQGGEAAEMSVDRRHYEATKSANVLARVGPEVKNRSIALLS